ncbi:hypothetical protein KJ909_02555, partial [Patescibacteria group bacterium]|nr:hypothetical protein [Patescibacteria group bacterium]
DQYHLKIIKDGYLPWEKTVQIKKETVYQTDAQLFRAVPDLKPLTYTGAVNPVVSPDHTTIIYAVASASATLNNGLYQLSLSDRPLPLNKNLPKQLYSNLPYLNWSDFTFEFSPDSLSVLATNGLATYLIDLTSTSNSKNLYDITPRLSLIKQEWDQLTTEIINNKIKDLPEQIRQVVSTTSAKNISYSSSEEKVLYLADHDGQMKDSYITPPPAQSQQTQHRDLQANHYYIYDIKDDTNFLLGSVESISRPFWLPNSNNIVYVSDSQIKTVEYDNTNTQTLFAGEFQADTVYPWSDGNRIITLTSAYSPATKNLYAISIR